MNNKKIIITVILVAALILLVVGGTAAYWTWITNSNQKTTVTFTTTANLSCSADGGGNITSNDVILAPAKCTDSVYAIKREITTSTTTSLNNQKADMDLWLDINNIASVLANSNYFKYAVTKNANSCTSDVITAGASFKSKISNNKAYLFTNKEYIGSQNDAYYLYIWLDEAETNNETMNKTFDFSLNGECRDKGTN